MKQRRARALRRAGAPWLAMLLSGLGSLACEARDSAPQAPPAAPASPARPLSAARPLQAPPAIARPDTRPTVVRVAESARVQGTLALASGAKLPLDAAVVVPPGASLDLHFPGGASVRVVGPARVASPAGPTGLLVNEGTVTVDLELSALHPGSGFWLATPRTRIDLVQGARFALRAFADRSAKLVAVSGMLTLTTLNADASAPTRLAAGARATVSPEGSVEVRPIAARADKPREPLHLQREEARLHGLPERPATRQAAAMGGARPMVEAACEAVVASMTREQELSARHRALVAQNDSRAMEVQRELARQGAHTFAVRRTLGKHLSLLEAESLSQGTSPSSTPLIARARELLR